MKTQEQILEEIKRCAPDDLKEPITGIIRRTCHSRKQQKAVEKAWNGLLWWRRTHVEEMVSAYENK